MQPEKLDIPSRLQPLKPPQRGAGSVPTGTDRVGQKSSFSKVLAGELVTKSGATKPPAKTAKLEFSAHAQARLIERNIILSPHSLERLDQGIQLADRKGGVNTLVLMDDTAFIVSVKNRKVITAITKDAAIDNVFTQIDSAMIV